MKKTAKSLISEEASVFKIIDTRLESGEIMRKIKAIENINGIDIRFSITRQLPITTDEEITPALCASSGYLYRGTASVVNPLNNRVLEFEGKKRREILATFKDGEKMIDGSILLTRSAERALKCTHQIYFNDDTEEKIKKKIADIARKMYMDNTKQLNRLVKKRTNPSTITPAEAASLYLDNYIVYHHSNASDDCNAKRKRAIAKYYSLMDNIPMSKYSSVLMGKFIKNNHIPKSQLRELCHFWKFCTSHCYCFAVDPFDDTITCEGRKSPKASQNAAMERRMLDSDETIAFFDELEKSDPALACGAGLVFLGLPDKFVTEMLWDRIIFNGPDYAVVQICDVNLDGKERSGATHNLSFVALPQIASILYRHWNKLVATYGEAAVRQRRIFSDDKGNDLKVDMLRGFISKTVARIFNKASTSYSYRLPANIGNTVLSNTYDNIVDDKCGIPDEDIGTRRFLKHMSMAANVTNDHYVPFVGDEAWDYQYTILKRQMPSEDINEANTKDSHEGITTERFYPDETSENINVYAHIKLKPGGTFIAIGKHAITGDLKKANAKAEKLAA